MVLNQFVCIVVRSGGAERGRNLARDRADVRHTPAKKNKTDGADTPSVVPLRYLIAFAAPTVIGIRAFLARKGRDTNTVDRMQHAWTKAGLLQIALWSRPYIQDGLW